MRVFLAVVCVGAVTGAILVYSSFADFVRATNVRPSETSEQYARRSCASGSKSVTESYADCIARSVRWYRADR